MYNIHSRNSLEEVQNIHFFFSEGLFCSFKHFVNFIGGIFVSMRIPKPLVTVLASGVRLGKVMGEKLTCYRGPFLFQALCHLHIFFIQITNTVLQIITIPANVP